MPLEMLLEGEVVVPSGTVSASDWSSIVTAIQNQISVSTVVGVLASAITACIALVFMWWGVRKVTKMIMSAFKKGKLRI